MTGKKFPVSEDAFDKEISKTAFKRLDAIDPDIYKQTKEGLVMMGKTCSEFYDDKLHRMGQLFLIFGCERFLSKALHLTESSQRWIFGRHLE